MIITVACAVKARVFSAVKSGHNGGMTFDSFDSAIPRGTYRHYKDRLYQVFGTAVHSETEEVMVVYTPLYEQKEPRLWVRPLAMFTGTVETADGMKPRFERIEPA